MDRGPLSNILAATRLLPHFSQQNLHEMKSCIFEQLGCKNEYDFISKALNAFYKTMSVESTSIIKAKAIEIADSQSIEESMELKQSLINSDKSSDKRGKETCNNHVTVYKHIQVQYRDPLSQLHSDIIDYLGTFLTKQESIHFGYLNKQLYIETQNNVIC